MGKDRERSPSVECLRKKVKRLQEQIEVKLQELPVVKDHLIQRSEGMTPLMDTGNFARILLNVRCVHL